jgi:5-hydroxyisourate hydrolase
MATVSSHTLNSVDGTHAKGIGVTLTRIGETVPLFETEMDVGGRLSQDVDLTNADPEAMYELVFAVGPYWEASGVDQSIPEIVLRFKMRDLDATYHMPIILSPHGYSMWSSATSKPPKLL